MNPIDQPQIGLAAVPEVGNKTGVLEGRRPERRSGHAAAGQEGLDFGEKLFGGAHNDANYRIIPILQEDNSYFPQNRKLPTIGTMNDAARQVILGYVNADKSRSLKRLSMELGLSHSYFQQFIKYRKPETLPEEIRRAVAELIEVPEEKLRGESLRSKRLNHDPKKVTAARNPTLNIIPAAELIGDVDLPVYSIVQGGRGALVLENEPFTYTSRPRRLAGKKGVYGVLVRGNSMAREYNENDIAYVDPNLHARKGDPCVFQGVRDDGTVEAMMKYLERSPDASETLYYVSQTNPPKKFTVKKADWQKCHVAVGKESGR